MESIRVAITKGRLEKCTIEIFENIGVDCESLKNKGRKLIFKDEKNNIEFILAKAADVLTYVEHGAADIGIVGKDTLMEQEKDFYEVLDLKEGICKFVIASLPEFNMNSGYETKTIASKYPNVTKKYFKSKGEDVNIIKIEGSVELAPILKIADAILDIYETGKTLKENGLVVKEDVYPISARMIVNKSSMKMKKDRVSDIIVKVQKFIDEK